MSSLRSDWTAYSSWPCRPPHPIVRSTDIDGWSSSWPSRFPVIQIDAQVGMSTSCGNGRGRRIGVREEGTDRGWVAAIVPVAGDGQKRPSTHGRVEVSRGRWFRCTNHSVYWFLATYCERYGSIESSVHSKPQAQLAFWFSGNKNNIRVRLPCIHFIQTKMSFRLEHKHKNGIVGNNNMTSKQIWIYKKNSYPYKESSDRSEQQIYKK
jgi:hypothetical protein